MHRSPVELFADAAQIEDGNTFTDQEMDVESLEKPETLGLVMNESLGLVTALLFTMRQIGERAGAKGAGESLVRRVAGP